MKTALEIITEERDMLRGRLDFYEQFDHVSEVCAADAWHDLAFFEGDDAEAKTVILQAIQRVAGGLRTEINSGYIAYAENMKQANHDYLKLESAFYEKANRVARLEALIRAILEHPNIPSESVQCCRDAKAYLSK